MKRFAGSVAVGTAFTALMLLRLALGGIEMDPLGIVGAALGASAVAYLVWNAFDAGWSQLDRKIEPKWVVRFAIVAVANFVLPHALATLTGWSIVVTTIIYLLVVLFVVIVWLLARGYRMHR